MASSVRPSHIIKRSKRDRDAENAEYKYSKALLQLGANKLLEAVKADKVLLNARDLQALQQIKREVAFDDLEDSGMHFISCNACLYSKACSLCKPGEDCRFNLSATEILSSKDIVKVMVQLLQIEGDRIQRSLLIEKMEGSVDGAVSMEILQYFEMVNRLKNIMSQEESVEIRVKGKGAISKLFGDMLPKNNTPKIEENIEAELPVKSDLETIVISPRESKKRGRKKKMEVG